MHPMINARKRDASGAVFPYLLIRFGYRSGLGEFGVRWIDPHRPVLPWLLASSGLAVLSWFAFWGAIVGGFQLATSTSPDSLPMTLAELYAKNPLHRVIHGEAGSTTLAYLLHMGLFVGFAEELVGRGLLNNALDRRYQRVFPRRPLLRALEHVDRCVAVRLLAHGMDQLRSGVDSR